MLIVDGANAFRIDIEFTYGEVNEPLPRKL